MNKKFTLLAAALMTIGTFTAASAADVVPSDKWTAVIITTWAMILIICPWTETRLIRL